MKTSFFKPHTIAIIGASTGQLPLVLKAKEKGVRTVCFAWENGAICKDECDEFYPISIFETEEIVKICKELDINGVATTASEETALACSIISNKLGLTGNSPLVIKNIQDKKKVRYLTKEIKGLSVPKTWTIDQKDEISYPCVVKPIKGSAKKGVSYCDNPSNFDKAIIYTQASKSEILIEEYISGDEYSVESLSYHGNHNVIQITQKITTGFPHFAELEHHQPAIIDGNLKESIIEVVKKILSAVNYANGASHIEIKVNDNKIYLIEINPRGGGDRISDTLVGMSTDCDYLSAVIDIALNQYDMKPVRNVAYCGILYLTAQNSRILKYFDNKDYDWLVERNRINNRLTVSSSNYDRDGYIIYKSPIQINL